MALIKSTTRTRTQTDAFKLTDLISSLFHSGSTAVTFKVNLKLYFFQMLWGEKNPITPDDGLPEHTGCQVKSKQVEFSSYLSTFSFSPFDPELPFPTFSSQRHLEVTFTSHGAVLFLVQKSAKVKFKKEKQS